jgi:NAD(P)H-dependent FMN reductase
MIEIAIIVGSTRPGRNGEAVAKWVYEVAKKRSDAEFELVDIKDFNPPLLDEPVPPSFGQYSKPHTQAWAAKIDNFGGSVFVTPEYNHGAWIISSRG